MNALAIGLLSLFSAVSAPPSAQAQQSVELQTELFATTGASLEQQTMRVPLGEPSHITVRRAGGTLSLSVTVTPAHRAGCHTIHFDLRGAGSQARGDLPADMKSETITCSGEKVTIWRKQPTPHPVLAVSVARPR